VLAGQRVFSTLTGSGYLLLNVLEDFEMKAVKDMAAALGKDARDKWEMAVTNLPTDVRLIGPNSNYVHAALAARLTNGVGFVTLACNNNNDAQQVPPALPVSLSVIKVVPELYSGELEVLLPDDALAEQLSLRYSADMAGKVGDAVCQGSWAVPSGGLIPNTNFDGWPV